MKNLPKIFFLLSAMTLVACSANDPSDTDSEVNYADEVSSISVSRSSIQTSTLLTGYTGVDTTIMGSSGFVNGESLLFFSQLGNEDSQNPNFTDFEANASPYCYIYQYNENPNADWSTGYNFQVLNNYNNYTDRNPFRWSDAKEIGSVGNSFSFFAFFFPGGNNPVFQVQSNQTSEENILQSDIMGAYHAASDYYSRMRFRLFHLMVYLKITLYVPTYSDSTVGSEYSYTGFGAGAFQGGSVVNAYPGFLIEWRTERSSDTEAPLTQATGKPTDISMYLHPQDTVPFTLKNVSSFYPSYNVEGDTDEVRAYNMSVLVPAQTFGDNFLQFNLTDPDDKSIRTYTFSASQVVGSTGSYNLTQGTLQQLILYVPRFMNQTILVGANVLPWSGAQTDMTVSDQTSPDNQSTDD